MTAPSLIQNLPMTEYQSLKRLSASGAWTLAEECPAKFIWESPWNPNYQPDAKMEFDIGTAAHLAILEQHRMDGSIFVIDAADFRTNAAKEARDAARAAGLVPLLPKHLDVVQAVAAAIRAHPTARQAFEGGDPEVTMTWNIAGVPSKARIDYLPQHGRYLVDLKTAVCANPRTWIDQAFRLGYHARAAWYLDGAAEVLGEMPQEYWFVVVEKEPPHLVSMIAFDEEALNWGREANHRARELFLKCAASGDWHGYRDNGVVGDRAFRVSLPPWAQYRLQDRHGRGDFERSPRPDPRILRAAERWLEPSEA